MHDDVGADVGLLLAASFARCHLSGCLAADVLGRCHPTLGDGCRTCQRYADRHSPSGSDGYAHAGTDSHVTGGFSNALDVCHTDPDAVANAFITFHACAHAYAGQF